MWQCIPLRWFMYTSGQSNNEFKKTQFNQQQWKRKEKSPKQRHNSIQFNEKKMKLNTTLIYAPKHISRDQSIMPLYSTIHTETDRRYTLIKYKCACVHEVGILSSNIFEWNERALLVFFFNSTWKWMVMAQIETVHTKKCVFCFQIWIYIN